MKSLNENWLGFKNNPDSQPQLTYDYKVGEDAIKLQISEALLFWAFVKREVFAKFRKDFCRQFLKDQNPLVSIVAHIEILPDKVWRKILWVENIDFTNYEATLRRITDEQKASIIEAVQSLELPEPKMPRVFMKNIFDFIKALLGFVTPQKLIQGSYGNYSRYYSKGAWAFNLLNLDFGFSLYPQGINNDIQITNKKFSRFLSIKEHINDFIVNQEDGIYWLLYRTARSNFAWFPNKEVALKTHVCPGFWKTLTTHFMFWIVSPIGFTMLVLNWVNLGLFPITISNFCWTVFFSLTPLWIFSALIRIIVEIIFNILSILIPPLGVFLKKVLKLIIDFFDTKTAKVIGKILKFIGITFAILVIVSMIIFIIIKVWPILTNSFLLCLEKIQYVIHLAANYPTSFIFGGLGIISVVFGFYIIISTGLDEEKYAKQDKIIRWVIRLWFAISIFLGYLIITKENTFEMIGYHEYSSSWAFMINIFSFMVMFSLYSFTINVNMETIDKRLESKEKARRTFSHLEFGSVMLKQKKYLTSKFRKFVLKNKWLLSLKEEEYLNIISEINYIIREKYRYVFSNFERSDRFLSLILPAVDQSLMDKLRKPIPLAVRHGNNEEMMYFLQCLCSGLSFDVSVELTTKLINSNDYKREVKEKRKEKRLAILDSILKWLETFVLIPISAIIRFVSWPFRELFKLIGIFFKWLYRSVSTLKDLWSLFNERCPYISKSKFLE